MSQAVSETSEQASGTPDREAMMAAIKAKRLAGMSLGDIAAALGVKKWVVSQACQRLNLAVKNTGHEKPIIYSKVPFVKRRCLVCRGESMMHPVTWTCDYCKSKQDEIDTSVWD